MIKELAGFSSDSIGMRERWLECVKWRMVFVAIVAAAVTALFFVASKYLGHSGVLPSLSTAEVIVGGVLFGLLCGLVFWAPSPAGLRERCLGKAP